MSPPFCYATDQWLYFINMPVLNSIFALITRHTRLSIYLTFVVFIIQFLAIELRTGAMCFRVYLGIADILAEKLQYISPPCPFCYNILKFFGNSRSLEVEEARYTLPSCMPRQFVGFIQYFDFMKLVKKKSVVRLIYNVVLMQISLFNLVMPFWF